MPYSFIIGDSYTNKLIPYSVAPNKGYFTNIGIKYLSGIDCSGSSLSNVIDGIEGKPFNIEVTRFHERLVENMIHFNETKEKFKNNKINIFLLIGHVDLHSDYYYETFKKDTLTNKIINIYGKEAYEDSLHYKRFINNYKKLINLIKKLFYYCNIHVISLCPFLLKTKNIQLNTDNLYSNISKNPEESTKYIKLTRLEKKEIVESSFNLIRHNLEIINNGLKVLCDETKTVFIDIYQYMWDSKTNDYISKLYYEKPKTGLDSHTNPAVMRELLILQSPILKQSYKTAKHIGGMQGLTNFNIILIIILLLIILYYITKKIYRTLKVYINMHNSYTYM